MGRSLKMKFLKETLLIFALTTSCAQKKSFDYQVPLGQDFKVTSWREYGSGQNFVAVSGTLVAHLTANISGLSNTEFNVSSDQKDTISLMFKKYRDIGSGLCDGTLNYSLEATTSNNSNTDIFGAYSPSNIGVDTTATADYLAQQLFYATLTSDGDLGGNCDYSIYNKTYFLMTFYTGGTIVLSDKERSIEVLMTGNK